MAKELSEELEKEKEETQKQSDIFIKWLKIFGIYSLICFLISFGFVFYSIAIGDTVTDFAIIASVLLSPILPLIVILAFLPTIIILYFLFKIIKNINSRILLTAILIPFTNLIYLFIEHFKYDFELYSEIIGGISLFVVLPLIFTAALFSPKKLLPYKWEIIKTDILMIIFGIVLIFMSGKLLIYCDNIVEQNKLKSYEPIIQSIEEYKLKNGIYPSKVRDKAMSFRQFRYTTKNENKDYILTVWNRYTLMYNYCSSDKFEGCYPNKTKRGYSVKSGKWIKEIEYD